MGLSTVLIAGRCSREGEQVQQAAPKPVFTLDRAQAAADLAELTRLPHPLGSQRQAQVAAWLTQRIQAIGLDSRVERFTATVPNPEALVSTAPVAATLQRDGLNVYAFNAEKKNSGKPPTPCAIGLATHTDTKIVAGAAYVGANDSGSSTVLVLQLLAYAHRTKPPTPCVLVGMMFDGEEAVLKEWDDGEQRHPAKLVDHTYGSRYSAARLTECGKPGGKMCLPQELGGTPLAALILLDMVGSPGVRFSRDVLSTPELVALQAKALEGLGPKLLTDRADRIDDDHVPFLERGVKAVDLIDFVHLDYWHQAGDEAKTIDLGSLQLTGQAVVEMITGISPGAG